MKSDYNYMTQSDMQTVIDSIPMLGIRKWNDSDIQMLFKILYWCALRPIEGIMLKKESFDLESRNVYLGKTKTRHRDVALVPSTFVPELQKWLDEKDEGRLFPGLTYNTFYPWLKKLGRICGIAAWIEPQKDTREKTVGHIFRKSVGKDMVYGVILDNEGRKLDIPIISKHLRHKKPSITIDHYLKAGLETLKDRF